MYDSGAKVCKAGTINVEIAWFGGSADVCLGLLILSAGFGVCLTALIPVGGVLCLRAVVCLFGVVTLGGYVCLVYW